MKNIDLYTKLNHLGQGVFAAHVFKMGQKIIDVTGPVMTRSQLPADYYLKLPANDRYVQIGPDKYLGPSGSFDDLINHSCDPNAWVKINGDRAVLIALRDIPTGEEIVWDYSTTMDEDSWEMECHCGQSNCRGRVRDFKYLPPDIQEKYVRLGIIPGYIAGKLPQPT